MTDVEGIVGVVGSSQEHRSKFCSALAKRSESEGLEIYHRKGRITSLLNPSGYPDKVSTLCRTATLCSSAIVVLPENGKLGWQEAESILSLDAAGIRSGYIIANPGMVQRQTLDKILSGTSVSEFRLLELRQEEYSRVDLDSLNVCRAESSVIVSIDNAFTVKGVGVVGLGFVLAGAVKVHQNLYTPSGKKVEVKSIQVMDVDLEQAETGQRVGLAVRGLSESELEEEGLLVSGDQFTRSLSVDFRKYAYYPHEITPGLQVNLSLLGQTYSCVVKESGDGHLALETQSPVPNIPFKGALYNPAIKPGSLRIIGSVSRREFKQS
ncbi:MAG: hypothetical protein QXI37_02015 [Thermoprotei archaeon]